ncbi:type VI secretion system protein TssA [Mesorhizobium sp. M1C.F.Ca.ET.193.01.1.1]|uniref:type VI secretion system protein TssA n=1 Tax=unclassified Mesorhizobium TaxID=325217 RepID=UPI000FD33DD8|nr:MULTISPECIES: type VI secretion system protein TssA [unclassified Mesorhizobium]TGS98200.1 type VI secretion system protein TssA [bacterium M00.F.Ca.ET.177.01.1.1]RWG91078.1 MAG: type VI secretion system protein TssA [Mesorhizobium sp.]RWK22058.1 MAG: type VI secretion system protein TssA [Mesorhizobium sp.]TGQ52697.1 type VI secretion system protein TssA [Mesorhizobium sp. M1C.F.Ca.ET.210.01.1.1]TGQ69980.1 type VI secretion system protein TssA [Mesorhizobium sp. M1C.F.Ca.ET.212.01.1.1]
MIDLALWLNPLNGENPSGEDLRNDPAFHELERLTEPQVKVVHDGNNKPTSQASPVDWAAVLDKAEELRSRGRDLRLLVIVARALANEERLAGLAQGLTLIARTFDQHWETMHPALRPNAQPRDAALRRINALLDLQNAQDGLVANLRETIFFSPRQIGPISGRDLEQGALDERVMLQEAASGLGASEKAALASAHSQLLNRVRSGCAAQIDQAGDAMTSLLADARAAIAALDEVDAALNKRIDGNGPTIPELRRFLQRLLTTLERNSAAGAAANGAAKPVMQPAETAAPTGNGYQAGGAEAMGAETMASVASHAEPGARLPDRITSRDDVVRCLDLVVAFYDRTEPSSPIPHLARRVRRMVHMDFVELMEDLAPSGLKEFRQLAGVPDPKKPAQKDER